MSLVLGAAAGRRAEHLERLANLYWRPIYCFIRRAWSRPEADARDLTQSFFVSLLEQDAIARYDASRGGFRAYLKQCLRNFLSADARQAATQKRGGRDVVVSMEGLGILLDRCSRDPEAAFDETWTRDVVNAALGDLEAHLKSAGRSVEFEVLRAFAIEGSADSYKDVQARLGLTETQVRSHLRHARRELRRHLVRRIEEYAGNPQEAAEEVGRILGEESP